MDAIVDKYLPQSDFINNANLPKDEYELLLNKAKSDYIAFWAEQARKYLSWQTLFTKTLNKKNAPFYKWFEDGLLNVSYNCLDKHLANIPNKVAIIFEADDESSKSITYKELHIQVCKFANGLKSIGAKAGDRVIIYLPHSIEAIIAMQACARIGAIHSVVFGGFSAKALAERIADAGAKYLITANSSTRGGKTIFLKNEVNLALDILENNSPLSKLIVYDPKKLGIKNDQFEISWADLIKYQENYCPIEIINSEHPLFILYTSGSTGKPKGVQHSSAGYLLGAILSMKWVFDIKPNDIFWCTADVGWITGHTYVCYGPLALGATQVIFEGIPTYPNASRYWQIINKYKVSIFYTAPTVLRSLIKIDTNLPNNFNLSSLRLLGSVGEPINPEVWRWYYNIVGKKQCPIVDTWWQTETGSHILAPIPGITTLKPGSCTLALPGIFAEIVNENGIKVKKNKTGYLVIKKPFPSQIRTIWGDSERYINTYFPKNITNGKYYVSGDSAYKDNDGYFWISGRIDDVLNVSGHRLGTMEIESALIAHPEIAEAAIVGVPHPIKGEAIHAFVVCTNNVSIKDIDSDCFIDDIKNWVGKQIGPIAKPEEIIFVDSLPKTRSGKIMRRLLKSIAKGEIISQDTSTLESDLVLNQLKP